MSCIQITACQPACLPSALPAQAFQLNKASTFTSIYLGTKLPKISPKLTSGTSRYRPATVCLFGGKGKSENGNEASPWQALEKAASNFKKDLSIEDVLKQQMENQEYFDDEGSGGKGPGGGGRGGDDSGEADDEGSWDEFVQMMLATSGFIFLYIYIIRHQEVNVFTKDFIRFIFTRQTSFRLKRLFSKWKRTFRAMKKVKEVDDPYWLERLIINTPTCFDHPAKYKLKKKRFLSQ